MKFKKIIFTYRETFQTEWKTSSYGDFFSIFYREKEKWNYPELIVFAGWTLFDKGAEIGGDVAVVWKFFQDVDLQFDFFFLVLENTKNKQAHTNIE